MPVRRRRFVVKGNKRLKEEEQQGYGDRKRESIAMRSKKKRTGRQLRSSADESYGKHGSKSLKSGKINR